MSASHLKLTLHFLNEEPEAAARKLELLPAQQAASVLQEASLSAADNVLRKMLPSASAKLFPLFSPQQCFKLVEKMSLSDLAAIIRYMQNNEQNTLIKLLPLRKQTLCKMLISYPEYAVGSMVETDMLVVDNLMNVKDTMIRLRKKSFSYLQDIYVVNQGRQLAGQIFIGDLLKSEPTNLVSTLLVPVKHTISASFDLLSAYELDLWRNQDTVAVVNRKQEFVGIVHFHRLRHFMTRKELSNEPPHSLSADMFETYGDTIVSMADLISPMQHNR